MGNNIKSLESQEKRPFIDRFSQDPAFERYFYSNIAYFLRIPHDFPGEESLNSDCFGCFSLKKPQIQKNIVNPFKNWLFYMKKQCEELKNDCK